METTISTNYALAENFNTVTPNSLTTIFNSLTDARGWSPAGANLINQTLSEIHLLERRGGTVLDLQNWLDQQDTNTLTAQDIAHFTDAGLKIEDSQPTDKTAQEKLAQMADQYLSDLESGKSSEILEKDFENLKEFLDSINSLNGTDTTLSANYILSATSNAPTLNSLTTIFNSLTGARGWSPAGANLINQTLSKIHLLEQRGGTVSDMQNWLDQQDTSALTAQDIAHFTDAGLKIGGSQSIDRTNQEKLAQLASQYLSDWTSGKSSEILEKDFVNLKEFVDSIQSIIPIIPPTPIPPVVPSDDSLLSIQTSFNNWVASHPGELTNDEIAQIRTAITDLMASTDQNSGFALRSYIQSTMRELFATDIYSKVPTQDLKDLFTALNFNLNLLPSATVDTPPTFKAGYVAVTLKGLSADDCIQIANSGGYLGVDAQGNTYLSATPVTLHTTDLPKAPDGSPMIYIPAGFMSGRLTVGQPEITEGSTFSEFSVRPDGVPFFNFTGVNGIPLTPAATQITTLGSDGKYHSSSNNGIIGSRSDLLDEMKELCGKYDPDGSWKSMFNSDGTVKSGKQLTDPAILQQLSDYLTKTFIPGFDSSNPMYFTSDDGTVYSGTIQKSGDGWAFVASNGISVQLPKLTDIDSWISGSDAGWNAGDDSTPESKEKWGIVKALSGLINTGILPKDTNSSPTNPINGAKYFTNIENVANYYKADFYNLYRRIGHEAGINAYLSDFDDATGADGTVSAPVSAQPSITISFGSAS